MALLRLSDGRIFTTVEGINKLIGTVSVGKFTYPDDVRAKVEAMRFPLTEADLSYIEQNLDPALIAQAKAKGIVNRRIGILAPSPDGDGGLTVYMGETAEKASKPVTLTKDQAYAAPNPHKSGAAGWHFVMTGAIIKGLELEGGLQGVLYTQAGEWMLLEDPQVTYWVLKPSDEPTIGFSFFDKEVGSFGTIGHPEVQFLPGMGF